MTISLETIREEFIATRKRCGVAPTADVLREFAGEQGGLENITDPQAFIDALNALPDRPTNSAVPVINERRIYDRWNKRGQFAR